MKRGVLSDEVLMILKVAHSLVEPPSFQVVVNADKLFILPFDLTDDGTSISFELGSSLVMAVVSLDFSGGDEVQHTDRHS
jgi:hypothetical protein